jgi:pyruvate formate lyase activating enzyme
MTNKPMKPALTPLFARGRRCRTVLFGGLQRNSLIDYPGRISCVLFVAGCNFHCPYCHNPDLVRGPFSRSRLLDEMGIVHFLEDRKGFLDGVVVSGGEPTLQDDLIAFCEKTKALGYPVKLDTNGSRPRVIEELIRKGFVDYIAMDIKTEPLQYEPFVAEGFDPEVILESIRTIMGSGLSYEFRTTCVGPFVDARIIEGIGKTIEGARLWALQAFRFSESVLDPTFFEGAEKGYDPDALLHLKSIAAPWVKECIVR